MSYVTIKKKKYRWYGVDDVFTCVMICEFTTKLKGKKKGLEEYEKYYNTEYSLLGITYNLLGDLYEFFYM